MSPSCAGFRGIRKAPLWCRSPRYHGQRYSGSGRTGSALIGGRFADMGRPYQGVQAEYLRVPYGDFNCLRLGEDAVEKELDYVMVADIFPTGWHATEKAGCTRGTLSSFTVQDPSG
jgi:threonine dehydrogenase-like Zn-dependent dehydrogenase